MRPIVSLPGFRIRTRCIEKAKAWLRETVEAEKAQTKGPLSGLAGAASGTDLLFHEVCAELGIQHNGGAADSKSATPASRWPTAVPTGWKVQPP